MASETPRTNSSDRAGRSTGGDAAGRVPSVTGTSCNRAGWDRCPGSPTAPPGRRSGHLARTRAVRRARLPVAAVAVAVAVAAVRRVRRRGGHGRRRLPLLRVTDVVGLVQRGLRLARQDGVHELLPDVGRQVGGEPGVPRVAVLADPLRMVGALGPHVAGFPGTGLAAGRPAAGQLVLAVGVL